MMYNVWDTKIVFTSCLHYESHYADDNTMRLCLFLKDSADSMSLGNMNMRVTRNARVRKQQGNKANFLK